MSSTHRTFLLVTSLALTAFLALIPAISYADEQPHQTPSISTGSSVTYAGQSAVSEANKELESLGDTIDNQEASVDESARSEITSDEINTSSQNQDLNKETNDLIKENQNGDGDELSRPENGDGDEYSENGDGDESSENGDGGDFNPAIENGSYTIGTAVTDGKVADAANGSSANGTQIWSFDSNGTDAQVWRFETDNEGITTIYHAASGQALDVANGNAFDGAKIQLFTPNGTNAQKWLLIKDGNYYKIASLLNINFVLDVWSASTSNYAPIQLWTDNGTLAQRWYLTGAATTRQIIDALASENKDALSDGTYTIDSLLAAGKSLDLPGGIDSAGTKIQLFTNNKTDAQVWTISHDKTGYVTITHTNSGNVLDVYNGTATNGGKIWLYTANGTWAQKWIAISTETGIKFLSAINPKYAIDVQWAGTANETPIWLYEDNDSAAQRWGFTAATTKRQRLDNLAKENKDAIEDGVYAIRSELLISLVLEARGGATENYTTIQTYTANDTIAQMWQLSHDEKGYVTLVNLKSGKALDVANGTAGDGSTIWLFSPNGSWAQKWIAVKNGDSYTLISALSENFVLDVLNASKSNEAPTQLHTSNGTSAQSWYFTRADKDGATFASAVSENKITPIYLGFGDYFVALPSFSTVDNTTVTFDQDVIFASNDYKAEKGTATTLATAGINSLDSLVNLIVNYTSNKIASGIFFLKSTDISAIFVVSNDPVNQGREWVESDPDHNNAAKGQVNVVSSGGKTIYNGALSQIKGRGNSSWGLDKRPYQIKLDKKTDLLQTENSKNKAKTWLLISDGFDASSSRNLIAYSYAQLLGASSSIEFDFVDFYYDGEYRGTYLLCEKVQIANGRVEIEDLEEETEDANPDIDLDEATIVEGTNSYGYEVRYALDVNNPSDITGGYLIEHENGKSRYTAEKSYFAVMTSTGIQHFVCKSPEVTSFEEIDYISCLFQDIFDAFANNGIVPTTRGSVRAGMTIDQLINLSSSAKAYWINEILKNADGYTISSGYFYKDIDTTTGLTKIQFGPIWDFDSAMGNNLDWTQHENLQSPEGWFTKLFGIFHSAFNDLGTQEYIQSAKQYAVDTLREFINDGAIDQQMSRVSASLKMNELVWGGKNESYKDVVTWLNVRLDWVESAA